MMTRHNSKLVDDYLARLETAAKRLPTNRQRDLIDDMREHIEVSLAERDSPDDAEVRRLLDRLGDPEEIVTAALAEDPQSAPASAPASDARELGAVLCYVLGGVFAWLLGPLFAIAWVVGVALLWWSKVWTRRDKLIGSVVGLGAVPLLLAILAGGTLGPIELTAAIIMSPLSIAIGIYLLLRARQLRATPAAK